MSTIIINGDTYPIDRASSGIASQRRELRAVNSFTIGATPDLTKWFVVVNQDQHVGRYDTQATALGALMGTLVRGGANEVGAIAALSSMMVAGTGAITPDGDNILGQSVSLGLYSASLRSFDVSTFKGTVGIAGKTTNQMFINSGPFPGSVTQDSGQLLIIGSDYQTRTTPARYGSQYSMAVTMANASVPDPLLNSTTKSVISYAALTGLNVSFPVNDPIVGVAFVANSTVTGLNSDIPVEYNWVWSTVVGGVTAEVQNQTTSSITNSYIPVSGNAGKTLKCILTPKYAYDSVSTGLSANETSSTIGEIWTWNAGVTGTPNLIETTAGATLTVYPTTNSSSGSTGSGSGGGLAYTNNFYKDSTSVQDTAATTYNITPVGTSGTYSCDVTVSQSFNGQAYTSTRSAGPNVVVSTVADIKLFTDLARTNEVTGIPPTNTILYAYGYDSSGTLITANITWTDSASFVPSDISSLSGWYDPSDSSTITLSGADVTAVANRVSGAPNLGPDLASPSILTADLNGYDVFDFAGTDGLKTPTTDPGPYPTTSTIMLAADLGTDLSGVMFNGEVSAKYGPVYTGGNNSQLGSNWGSPLVYVDAISLGSNANRGDMYTAINNNGWNIIGSVGQDLSLWQRLLIFNFYASGFACTGQLAEVTIFSEALSTANRQKMEGYYAWKYALTANLPAGHPYKTVAP